MSKSNATNRELWKKLYTAYMIDGHSMEEVAEIIGYDNENSISKLRTSFGLPARSKQYLFNPLARQFFTDEQEQILLGGLLGDGCIMDRDSRNPIYVETHSVHQLEYINWKQSKLYPFVTKVRIGHKEEDAYIHSVALPQLKFYRGAFYPAGHKIVPVEALDWMDDLAVAVWYMDDGSLSQPSGQIRLHTCGFNLATVGMLQGWLATKYKVLTTVQMMKGKYPSLCVQKHCNERFFKIVEPYIIPSMRYKLGQ
jgi:recombination protein RecA